MFRSVDEVAARLAETGYLASPAVATTVFLADRLGKPLLVEGPAGVGKTELAKDRKSTRLNSSHAIPSRMPSSA